MTENTIINFSDTATGGQRTFYAFLAEKEQRSGSHRTMEGYSRMLQDFFGRSGKQPCFWQVKRGPPMRKTAAPTAAYLIKHDSEWMSNAPSFSSNPDRSRTWQDRRIGAEDCWRPNKPTRIDRDNL